MTGLAWVGGGITIAAVVMILLAWVLGDTERATRVAQLGCGAASVGAIWMAAALELA